MQLFCFPVLLNNTRTVFKFWYKSDPTYPHSIYQCHVYWMPISHSLRRFSSFWRNKHNITKERLVLLIINTWCVSRELCFCLIKYSCPFFPCKPHCMTLYFIRIFFLPSHNSLIPEKRDVGLNQRAIQKSYLRNFINWMNSCEWHEQYS